MIGNSRSPLGRGAPLVPVGSPSASYGPRGMVGKEGSSTAWEGLQELRSTCQPLCNAVEAAGTQKQLMGSCWEGMGCHMALGSPARELSRHGHLLAQPEAC